MLVSGTKVCCTGGCDGRMLFGRRRDGLDARLELAVFVLEFPVLLGQLRQAARQAPRGGQRGKRQQPAGRRRRATAIPYRQRLYSPSDERPPQDRPGGRRR